MTGQTYSPGSWIGLVSGGAAVLLEPGADDDLVQQLWQALESGATLESLLGTVVSGCGANLSAMPQFAIVSTADGIHAVLRGDVVVSADSDGQELSGHGVSSWTEGRLASDSVDLAARIRRNRSAVQPGPWLPLRAGAVQLGTLRLGAVRRRGAVPRHPPPLYRLPPTARLRRRPRCRSTGAADLRRRTGAPLPGLACPKIWT